MYGLRMPPPPQGGALEWKSASRNGERFPHLLTLTTPTKQTLAV